MSLLDQSGCAVNGGLLESLRNGTGDCDFPSEMKYAGEAIRGSTQAKEKQVWGKQLPVRPRWQAAGFSAPAMCRWWA